MIKTFHTNFSHIACFRYFLIAQPLLKCYSCQGSGQECRDEVVSKNSSAQTVCGAYGDRCFWAYQRFNSSVDIFFMGCITESEYKQRLLLSEEAVSSNIIECFESSCCDSNFCNKLKYTGRYES